MRVSTIFEPHTFASLILSLRGVIGAAGALLSFCLFGPPVTARATPLSDDEQRQVGRQFARC